MKSTLLQSDSNRKTKTPVLLLEQNDLAALYLQQILQRCVSLAVTRWDHTDRKELEAESGCVVVVDRGTLSFPFSRCLQLLRLATDKAAVLVIDQPRPSQEILELMALGVHGYVSYSEVGELVPAIKSVSQGQFWLKVNAIQSRRTVGPAVGSSDVGSLTDRERAVIVLLQRRLSNKEISTELRISESTVKFHLGNIFSKLGLRDRTSVSEAVRSVALVNHDV